MSVSRRTRLFLVAVGLAGLALALAAMYRAWRQGGRSTETEMVSAGNDAAEALHWWSVTGVRWNIRRAIAGGNSNDWQSTMGELRNPRYRHREAVEILGEFLDHPQWDVKIVAAEILLQLGVARGTGVLKAALKLAGQGGEISERMAGKAASALAWSQVRMDSADLGAVYRRYPSNELLNFGACQGHAWVAEVVRATRARGVISESVELAAGMLTMNDADSLTQFRRLAAARGLELQVIGNWGLYRASGDQLALRKILDLARETIGLGASVPGPRQVTLAVGLASSADDPGAAALMREIADRPAAADNTGGFSADSALMSLLFVHQDYEYIDRRIADMVNGRPTGGGGEALWRMAATRRTPEIEALARARNGEAYELYFIRMKEHPLRPGPRPMLPTRRTK